MKQKTNNMRNRPPEYESKFKTLILEYLKKNRLVNIPELEKKIKDEGNISIRKQTLRYNLRVLGKKEEIDFYIILNPAIKSFKIPEDEEIFIGLPIPPNVDWHPKILLELIDQLSNSNRQIANQSYAEFIQLFIKRIKTNLSIDAYLYEIYLKNELKYTEKEIYDHVKMYRNESRETTLQNAEIEAKRLADFLIKDATEEFKKKVANQLSSPNKDGKYDLNFEYKI